jgi:hypothetical protein
VNTWLSTPTRTHCPYCEHEVELSWVTRLAGTITGRTRTGFLVTHWPTPGIAHQWHVEELAGWEA